jgi:ankyrin repeat protein
MSRNGSSRNLSHLSCTPNSVAAGVSVASPTGGLQPLQRLKITVHKVRDKAEQIRSCALHDLEMMTWITETESDLSSCDNDGNTVLHNAAMQGRLELIPFLIEHGADVNAKNKLQQTPLICATKHGNVAVVQCLLQNGGNPQEGIYYS